MNEVTRRPPKRRIHSAPKDDRTKFDKWLDKCSTDLKRVHLAFAIPPRDLETETSADVMIAQVDRYMLLVEFEDSEAWWVSKSIISGATLTDDVL